MPTISWFYGIAIRMYLNDHSPPHFHAVYGEFEAQIVIETGEILNGFLPATARRLVREWAEKNQTALKRNWECARSGEPLEKIDGLDVEQGR
jgi:hypothetical protein